MAKKQKDSDNQNNRPNRVRNRLVGLATLLFILAAIAPWILTDKSSLRTSITPILQSSVVNGQITSSAEIDNIDGNTYSVPYAIDSETVIDNSMPPDIPVDPEISNQNSTQSTTEPTLPTSKSKTYFIQVVALNNKQKIEELVALLTLNSYNVRLVQKPGRPTALQVGPYAKKEQAEQVMIDLVNLTKLKDMSIIN